MQLSQQIVVLVLCAVFLLSQAQNTFTVPNEYPCPGEEVVMYCYIEPPTSENFLTIFTPDISINGSGPYLSYDINSNQIPGIDTSRYKISDVSPYPKDPKLAAKITITSYLPQDSATTFGCHGEYYNGSFSAALASGEAPMPASAPDQIYFVHASIESVGFYCIVYLDVRFSPPESEKPIQYYELYSNGFYARQLDNKTGNSFFDNPETYLFMTPGDSYDLRVAAVSCAGKAPLSQFDTTVSLPLRTLGFLFYSYLDLNNNLDLNWFLSDVNSTTLTIGYSLEVTTTFLIGSITTVVTQTTEFSLPSTETEYEFKLGLSSLGERAVTVNTTATIRIIEQCSKSLPGSSETDTNTGTSTVQPIAIITGNSTYLGSFFAGIIILILIIFACAVCNVIFLITLIVTCCTRNTVKYNSVTNTNLETLSPGHTNLVVGEGQPYTTWTAPT